jgi:hypothetical protein
LQNELGDEAKVEPMIDSAPVSSRVWIGHQSQNGGAGGGGFSLSFDVCRECLEWSLTGH